MRAEQIVETAALRKRPVRAADYEAQNRAFSQLARTMAEEPAKVPDVLTKLALQLCSAGSVGISIIEKQGTDEIFRLRNISGKLSPFEGGTMPRDESPCGNCVDRRLPQLYKNPADMFGCCQGLTPDVQECLVVPILAGDRPLGSLWIASHDPGRHFDAEDARLMTSLADFAGAALKMLSATGAGQLSSQAESNRMHVQQLRTSCRLALDNYVGQARATCDLAAAYPLSMEELDDLKERRDEEHNAYWKYMDVRQDLLNILILDAEGTPDRFKG